MNKIKKHQIYSITLTLILILACTIHSINADSTEITTINIDSINLSLTNSCSTFITINNVTDLAVASFEISWDPSIIDLISIDDSSNLFDMVITDIDSDNGTLKLDVYKFGDGLTGNLNVCSLEFEAALDASDGDCCNLSIQNSIMIVDTLLDTIIHEVNNGIATITDENNTNEAIIVYAEDIDIPYLGTNSGYIQVLNVTDLAFISLNLSWDPSIVNLTLVNTSGMNTDFDSVFFTINNDEGKLSLDAYTFGNTGLNGQVNIAYLTFESTSGCMIGDATPLIINNSILWNINPDQINHTVDDGTVIIVNNTTGIIINIDDITIPANGYNTSMVEIFNCNNLAIASFDVAWDPSIIKLTSINTSENITDFDIVFYSVDEDLGIINFDAYKFGSSGLNGDINVAELVFEAVNNQTSQEEQCNLTISNSTLWGAIPYTINHSVDNGIATIIPNDNNDTPTMNMDSINIISTNSSLTKVSINDVTDLVIAFFNVSWDHSVINLISINDSSNLFDMVNTDIDSDNGTLRIDAYKFGAGLTGNLDVCSLEFEAAPGTSNGDWCNITISNDNLWNSNLELIYHRLNNGTATIYESIEPLIGDAGGPYSGKESDIIQLHGSASGGIFPYEFHWDLDNDGYYNDSDAQNLTNTWTTTGTYTIALNITDSIGSSFVDITTVTITDDGAGGNGDGNGGSNNGGNDGAEEDQTEANNNPIAIIIISSNLETVDTNITFNASESSDPDGDNLTFLWNFGDGSTSTNKIISYSYKKPGLYNVTLTVDDSNGGKNSTSETVTIQPPANNPPEKPEISGPVNGSKNVMYTFSIRSSDLDNDNISYIINWDDGTTTTTVFDLSNMTIDQSHQWEKAGVYSITVIANDGKTDSQSAEHTMLIDAIKVKDIGYLVDRDNDGIYDEFMNKDGTVKTDITEIDGVYSLDIDNDGEVDYQYVIESDDLTEYQSDDDSLDEDKNYDGVIILGIVILLLLIIIAVVSSMRSKKQDDISKPVEEPKVAEKSKPVEKSKTSKSSKPVEKPKATKKSKPSGEKSKSTKKSKK